MRYDNPRRHNMTSSRNLIKDILCNVIFFSFFYSLFALTAALIWQDITIVLRTLLLAIPFVWNFLTVRYIKNRPLMLILHLIPPALAFYILDELNKIAFALTAIAIMMLYSLTVRIKGRYYVDTGTCIFMAISIVVMTFFAAHYEQEYMASIYPILVVIIIISCEIFTRMSRVDTSLDAVTKTSAQPVRQILGFDYKLIPVLVLVLIFLTITIRLTVTDPIITLISQIELPDAEPGEGPHEPLPPPPLGFIDMWDVLELDYEEPPEPHIFWQIIDAILHFLIQATVALLILTLIVSSLLTAYALMAYHKRKGTYTETEDEKTFIILEKVNRARRSLRSLLPFSHIYENRTRRMFRKKVLRHKKMGVPIIRSDTPVKMAEKIHDKENIKDLTERYEKVRYGS